MRTGKIGLRAFFCEANIPDFRHEGGDLCDKCDTGSRQTVSHILLTCPAYGDLRDEWRGEVGKRNTKDIRAALNEPTIAIPTAVFMLKTGALNQFRYVDIDELEETLAKQEAETSRKEKRNEAKGA